MKPQVRPWEQPLREDKAPTKKQRQLAMAVEQAGESIVITDVDGLIT